MSLAYLHELQDINGNFCFTKLHCVLKNCKSRCNVGGGQSCRDVHVYYMELGGNGIAN